MTTFSATDPEGGTIYWSLLPADEGFDANGNGSFTDEGDIAANAPDQADAVHFTISAQGVLNFKSAPDYEMPRNLAPSETNTNTYMVVVVASDDAPGAGGTKAIKKMVVTVTNVDEPGIVTLSSLQPQVEAELTATLVDPEVPVRSPTETWKWEKSQDLSSWTPIDSVDLAVRTPDATTVGYYLRATATYDDEKRTAQAVSVNKVRAKPTTTDAMATFPEGSGARSVAENSPAGTNVGDPVKANDTTDDVLTYSLMRDATTGQVPGGFQINPATGQITVGPRTVLDADVAQPTYDVMVTATEAGGRSESDGPLVNPVTVTITVNNVNEVPMVTGGVTTWEHAEDDADITTDDDAVLMVLPAYTASDPEVTGNGDECDSDSEGSTCAWSLQGADAGKFSISTAGALTFNDAPNYEAPVDAGRNNVYNVTVVATDNGVGGKNKMTATRAVTIMVTNVDENGTVTLSAQQPQVGVPITASVDDPDGGVTDITWQWYDAAITLVQDSNKVNEADLLTNTNAIEGATSATYTPTAADATKILGVLARYKDGKGNDNAAGNAIAVVIVKTDNAPTFGDAESGIRSIREDKTVSATDEETSEETSDDVGDPVRATDMDPAQILTYRLSRADAGSFAITSDDSVTARGGQITVKAGTKLDLRDQVDLHGDGHGHRPGQPQRLHQCDHQRHGRERSAGGDRRR